MPDAVKPETDDVGEVAFPKLTTVGFPASDVHIPVPVPVNDVLEY